MIALNGEAATLIIDVQGFQYKHKEFIPKEMAAICSNTNQQAHYLFEPPYSFSSLTRDEKDHYRWLEKNYHGGIRWCDGYIQLSKLTNIFQNLCDRVVKSYSQKILQDDVLLVCKGRMKKEFLQSYLINNKIVDLDDYPYSFPCLKSLNMSTCLEHNMYYSHCALANVQLLSKCILNLSNNNNISM